MKITKRQLKRIIREEVEQLDYELSKDTTDMMLDKEYPEDVEAQEDSWAGGQNIHHQLDHSEAGGGDPQTRGIEVLRISESHLRKTIRYVIVESAAEQLLHLPKSPSPMTVYQSVLKWMSMYQDPSKEPDAGLVDSVIANVMVKNQVSKDDPIVGQKLNMLRKILNPDLGRRQSYRRGIEDEMRQLDPTGIKQKTGRIVRAGNQAVERDY
jgi:hypothetical protein